MWYVIRRGRTFYGWSEVRGHATWGPTPGVLWDVRADAVEVAARYAGVTVAVWTGPDPEMLGAA